MSANANPEQTAATKEQENLDRLFEIREELQLIAESDVRWSEYAENMLESLREAGYDV